MADGGWPADDVAADALRDPADGTLAFAGVKPGMTVGEFFPGGGYFTRMLSDIVGPRTGRCYGLENAGWKEAAAADRARWLLSSAAATSRSMPIPSGSSICSGTDGPTSGSPRTTTTWKIAQAGVEDIADFNQRVFAAS